MVVEGPAYSLRGLGGYLAIRPDTPGAPKLGKEIASGERLARSAVTLLECR